MTVLKVYLVFYDNALKPPFKVAFKRNGSNSQYKSNETCSFGIHRMRSIQIQEISCCNGKSWPGYDIVVHEKSI